MKAFGLSMAIHDARRVPAVPLNDRDIWSVAVNALEKHGDDIDTYLLGKVEEMNQAGNDDGLALWLAIAEHVAQLLNVPDNPDDLN